MDIEEAKKKVASEHGYPSFVELIKQEPMDVVHFAIRRAIDISQNKK